MSAGQNAPPKGSPSVMPVPTRHHGTARPVRRRDHRRHGRLARFGTSLRIGPVRRGLSRTRAACHPRRCSSVNVAWDLGSTWGREGSDPVTGCSMLGQGAVQPTETRKGHSCKHPCHPVAVSIQVGSLIFGVSGVMSWLRDVMILRCVRVGGAVARGADRSCAAVA
jgi:hypothetical protein